jgi:hypothetical protein
MARYTPIEILDLIIDSYMEADEEAVCSQQPLTYYNACWPSMWNPETAFEVGDVTRPPTQNGFVYECLTAGTTGTTEPPWSVTQDGVFADGTVEWKAHENYALINQPLEETDKTKEDTAAGGRKIIIGQKMGVTIHTDGTVSHTALIDNVNKKLKYVTVSQTSLEGDNNVVSGRTTLFHEFEIVINQPTELI